MTVDVVEEFLKLVAIDSPSKREGALAAYLKQRLRELGARVYEDDSASLTGSDTGNVIAFYPGNKIDEPVIMLAAHMDSIASTEGLKPQIRDGVIYSDGEHVLAADDKAGIAVILAVLSQLRIDKDITHSPIEVVLTVQEEVGLVGVKNLSHKLKSKYGYVLDGDGPVGTIINSAPSHNILDLVVEGKSAHAGLEPEKGVNAIVVAAHAISSVPSGRLDDETTSNFGIINGGVRTNVVPPRVEIKAEVRSRSKEKLEKETDIIIERFDETAHRYGAKLSYNKKLAYESFHIAPKHPVIKKALDAGRILGLDVTLKGTGGGLDANIFNSRGVACVALGIGYEKPHSNDESIRIDELQKSVKYVLAIVKAQS